MKDRAVGQEPHTNLAVGRRGISPNRAHRLVDEDELGGVPPMSMPKSRRRGAQSTPRM
jgi:hypothetical protein